MHVREIAPTHNTLREFVKYPFMLYAQDEQYVLMPVEQRVRGLLRRHAAMVANGVQSFLMAYDGERPVGRLLVGIDFRAIQRFGERQGYICQFECENDQQIANALFDGAKAFLKLNGITSIVGPNPVLFNDFGAGLLASGFETPPTFLSPYNPPYYTAFFEGAGFQKCSDHFTYEIPLGRLDDARYESVLRRAGKRFGYTIENVNLRHDLKRRSREFARVIAESTPHDWNVIPPSAEMLYQEFKSLKRLFWPEYVLLAYAEGRPVGLLLAVPDYNPVFRGIKGQMFPVGTFRMLFARSYIKRLRTVMLYVVPEFQNKGVEALLIHRAFAAAQSNGIKYAEAGMVSEDNLKMQLSVEKLGGNVTKVYRQYRLEI